MTQLVTGASGYVGRRLVRALLDRGFDVVATGRSPAAPLAHPRLRWAALDLGDQRTDWAPLLRDVECVHHLAWSTIPSSSNAEPAEDARVNIAGTLALLQAAPAARRLRVVFASSGGTVYGARPTAAPIREDEPTRPLSAHGAAKRAVESYLDVFALHTAIDPVSLRIGNIYGPGQGTERLFGVVAHFAAAALAGRPLAMFGDGGVVRDYVHVDDAVDAFLRAGAAPPGAASAVINIGSGRGVSLNDVVRALETALGRALPVERRPARAFDVPASVLDPTRALAELGWTARIAFADGLADVLASLREGGG